MFSASTLNLQRLVKYGNKPEIPGVKAVKTVLISGFFIIYNILGHTIFVYIQAIFTKGSFVNRPIYSLNRPSINGSLSLSVYLS